MSSGQHQASFRDPSGFLFRRDRVLYRQVNQHYALEYDHLINTGLYERLRKIGRLVAHEESEVTPLIPEISHKVILPEKIPFISYAYEWSFSQLKEAALVTLNIQVRALEVGMSLKDASAYNIQFIRGKAALIDTLSFGFYEEGKPWGAYRQFCQHFLAPLALMSKTDIRLGILLRTYIDGIPLNLASKLLPFSSKLNPGLMMHIHLHAKAQNQFADKTAASTENTKTMDKEAFIGLINSLKNTIKKLSWEPSGTEWGNYYEVTNYSDAAILHKKQLITDWVQAVGPKQVWDLGANKGVFSRLASDQGIFTVSFDFDPAAVEQNQQQVKTAQEKNILPLIMDLSNPSPAIGWHNKERDSLISRGPVDMVLALALIHHLAISNNVPYMQMAEFFRDISKFLVIEFIPKSDSQVQKLLQSRLDIFEQHTIEDFEKIFSACFVIHKKEKLPDSDRFLYLMESR